MSAYVSEGGSEGGIGRVRENCKEAWIIFADLMVDIMQEAYINEMKKSGAGDRASWRKIFKFGGHRSVRPERNEASE